MRTPVTFHQAGGANHIYLDSYKQWLSKQKMALNTWRSYYSRIKQFLLFIQYASGNNALIADASGMKEAGQLYIEFLKQSKRRNVNANINALNNFSCFLGMESVHFQCEPAYVKQTVMLTAEEQERFLDAVEQERSKRDKALALVLFYSGLRIGDCARLNIENIGSGAACIYLNPHVRLPLNLRTQFALKEWLEECTKETSAADAALWTTRMGRRLSMAGITFVIKRIAWRVKLKVTAETLRRTRLAKISSQLTGDRLIDKFGGFISAATLNKHGMSLPPAQDAPDPD